MARKGLCLVWKSQILPLIGKPPLLFVFFTAGCIIIDRDRLSWHHTLPNNNTTYLPLKFYQNRCGVISARVRHGMAHAKLGSASTPPKTGYPLVCFNWTRVLGQIVSDHDMIITKHIPVILHTYDKHKKLQQPWNGLQDLPVSWLMLSHPVGPPPPYELLSSAFKTHYKTPPLPNLCLKLCHVYVPEWRPQ